MGAERHILNLLLAAIVMIAAHLLPSTATAHERHVGQGSNRNHEVRQPTTIDPVSAVAAVSKVPAVAAPGLDSVRGALHQCPGCAGCSVSGCCGGPMILSSSAGLPLRLGHAVLLITANPPTPSGTRPEALPEPPRSRA